MANDYEKWVPLYWERYRKEMEGLGIEPSLDWTTFNSRMRKSGNLENAYGNIYAEEQQKIKQTQTDAETARQEKELLGGLQYKPTEEETIFANRLRQIVSRGEPSFEAPKFDPTTARKTYEELGQSEKFLEEEANRKLSEYYARVNPYGRGGGGETRAVSASNQGIISDRYGRAFGMAQDEFEKTYAEKYNEYMLKYNELNNAYATLNEVGKSKNEADRSVAMAKLSRLWQTTDTASERAYQSAESEKDREFYENISSKMEQPKKEWYDYATDIAAAGITAYTGVPAKPLLDAAKSPTGTGAISKSPAPTAGSDAYFNYIYQQNKTPWLRKVRG